MGRANAKPWLAVVVVALVGCSSSRAVERVESESADVPPSNDIELARQEPGRDTHEVIVGVDEYGRFTYSQNPVYVVPGDAIRWVSQQGPLAVELAGVSPLVARRFNGRPGHALAARVRPDALYGKYGYFIALEWEGRIWTDDPEIIVDPPPQPGDTVR
ncbi:MAG: hypothetical protein AMS25_03725 [Gemmatimonas sp. SM23_52]|nr:MAG: hypothetical protein AMS25_03725 [Gemmatimonas sp. SM23_52]